MIRPSNFIYGFHGTTSAALDSIARVGLQKTIGGGHWLGDNGVYFVPSDRQFALGFAKHKVEREQRHGRDCSPVVIRAVIDMDDCFDLLQLKYRELLRDFATDFLKTVPDSVWPEVPQDQIRRGLDSLVIREAMRTLKTDSGDPYASLQGVVSARFGKVPSGVYPPSGPLYAIDGKRSWFDLHDHMQLIVFDDSHITNVEFFDD